MDNNDERYFASLDNIDMFDAKEEFNKQEDFLTQIANKHGDTPIAAESIKELSEEFQEEIEQRSLSPRLELCLYDGEYRIKAQILTDVIDTGVLGVDVIREVYNTMVQDIELQKQNAAKLKDLNIPADNK